MPPGTETCPGVTCQQCAQNAVLIAELWEQLNAKDEEIARLRALVDVGREMADVLDSIVGPDFPLLLVERWRSLEGK